MNHATAEWSASKEPSVGTSAPLRSLLVPIDLTPRSDRVLGRIAQLPLAHDARVTLLHVIPRQPHAEDQRAAERHARRALAHETRHLAESLGRGIRLESLVTSAGSAPGEIAARARAAQADLIVMGRDGGSALRDTFLGSTAERVIRGSKLPVLVVRLAPRAAYRRPALALDLEQDAHAVLALMFRVMGPPRPTVQVIHAFDAPYHGLVYPSVPDSLAEERLHRLQLEASHRLSALLAASLGRLKVAPEHVPFWSHHVRFGPPRAVIRDAVQRADTDLLVLGTHGYSGVAHIVLGTVAGDVLRDVASDVLIVPPAAQKE
ncbi:MAG TPA: universal stress protein [Polyangiales bacterium]